MPRRNDEQFGKWLCDIALESVRTFDVTFVLLECSPCPCSLLPLALCHFPPEILHHANVSLFHICCYLSQLLGEGGGVCSKRQASFLPFGFSLFYSASLVVLPQQLKVTEKLPFAWICGNANPGRWRGSPAPQWNVCSHVSEPMSRCECNISRNQSGQTSSGQVNRLNKSVTRRDRWKLLGARKRRL